MKQITLDAAQEVMRAMVDNSFNAFRHGNVIVTVEVPGGASPEEYQRVKRHLQQQVDSMIASARKEGTDGRSD